MCFRSKRVSLSYSLPGVHIALWAVGICGSRLIGWKRLDLIGEVLAVLDFPVSILAMITAWVLPVWIEVTGFAILGTLWWYYLGRKADAWIAKADPRTNG